MPATGIGLRVTSYLASDPEDASRLKVVLAGEATRIEPGEAEIQLLVRDIDGKKILVGEQPVGEPTGDGLKFSTNIPLAPGQLHHSRGGHGRHRTRRLGRSPQRRTCVAARRTCRRQDRCSFACPPWRAAQPRLALDSVRQDERLALQVGLDGEGAWPTDVVFEMASTADGPALVKSNA